MSSPICQSMSLTVPSNTAISARIIGLFSRCRPLTVARSITAAVVFAFKSVNRARRFAHVGKKVGKDIPSFANGNAATAIIEKGWMVRVPTSLPHRLPNLINMVASHAMYGLTLCRLVSSPTTTTLRMATQQIQSQDNRSFPADAFAKPLNFLAATATSKTQNSETAKGLPFNIFESGIGWFPEDGNVSVGVSHIYLAIGEFWSGLREPLIAVSQAVSIVSPVRGLRLMQI